MDAPFYEFLRLDSPDKWRLEIQRDRRGADGGDNRWKDFTWARRVDVAPPLQISVLKTGAKRDVTFDIATSAPVLSARAAQILRSLGDEDIELISARVEGEADEYFVMNVLSLVKCLDEEKTQLVEKWTTDSYRPDRTGEYKAKKRGHS
ncbi:MAG: hypothetical protein ABSH22_20370 [Tepidisphaeraceae bacterium]